MRDGGSVCLGLRFACVISFACFVYLRGGGAIDPIHCPFFIYTNESRCRLFALLTDTRTYTYIPSLSLSFSPCAGAPQQPNNQQGMVVKGVRRSHNKKRADNSFISTSNSEKEEGEGEEGRVEMVGLEDLRAHLPLASVLMLALPGTVETEGMDGSEGYRVWVCRWFRGCWVWVGGCCVWMDGWA
jgi:hypothetical protein